MSGAKFPAGLSLTLVSLLDEAGANTNAILKSAGLSRKSLAAPAPDITQEKHLALVRASLSSPAKPGLGLYLGERVDLAHYGLIGQSMMNSATIGQAIDLFARYQKMTGPLLGMSIREKDDCVVIQRHDAFPLGDLHKFAVEEFLASWVSVLRKMTGMRVKPLKMRVDYPKPDYDKLYEKILGAPVQFGADAVELKLSKADLDCPLDFTDPELATALRERCDRMLDQMRRRGELIDEIRRMLLASPNHALGFDEVADRLHMSARTLRRRLSKESTSFRELTKEVKFEVSLQLLRQTNLPIKQIADLIGYENPANFARAFRCWSGNTPREAAAEQSRT